MLQMKSLGSSGRSTAEDANDDDEATKMAIATFQAKEEEIERKKMQMKERVESQLNRAEEETKRLAQVWEVSFQNIIIFQYEHGCYSCIDSHVRKNSLSHPLILVTETLFA